MLGGGRSLGLDLPRLFSLFRAQLISGCSRLGGLGRGNLLGCILGALLLGRSSGGGRGFSGCTDTRSLLCRTIYQLSLRGVQRLRVHDHGIDGQRLQDSGRRRASDGNPSRGYHCRCQQSVQEHGKGKGPGMFAQKTGHSMRAGGGSTGAAARGQRAHGIRQKSDFAGPGLLQQYHRANHRAVGHRGIGLHQHRRLRIAP